MTTTLVLGSDPSLRDRDVQHVIDELLGGVDRSLALDDHTVESRRRGAAGTDADASEADDDTATGSLELPAFAAVVNAVQSPPFMTECRVVVVREIGNLTTEQGKWLAEWVAQPLDGVHLVLVAGGGRVPAALDKACKANGNVVGSTKEVTGEQTAALLASEVRDAGLKLSADAASLIAARLGSDAGRVPELVELLRATYGGNATLDADAVQAYLGDVGTAERFALTNAIDKGELGTALEVLHRMLTATSASQPKPLHPMQVMASLVFHYQRLLKLDDPSITTNEQAAAALGMKSAYGARFPLEAARRLGSDGLREALGLLAQAELDLRGQSGLDERTAIDVLVARLAALSRRHARGSTRARAGRS
jgi:DNA polymerase-3 subunit delta